MKWLGVTIALLTASATLVIWIYVRDRHVSNWKPSNTAIAQQDAGTVLAALEGYHCHHGCSYEVLGRSVGSRWLARISLPWATRCFEIDIKAFTFSSEQGLSGTEQVRCPTKSHSGDRS